MPIEVIMPKVDMDMASGKVMSWHVAEGETVTKGDPLFDIETDKAAMEVEASDTGILHHLAPEGSDIPIGKPVAWLYAEGEEVGDQPSPFASGGGADEADEAEPEPDKTRDEAQNEVEETPRQRPDVEQDASDSVHEENTRATPKARSLAREEGLDLATIAGTGPRGRVQEIDVREALKETTAESAPARFRAETGSLVATRSKGGKGAPVVLIHGFAADATSWAPLEAHFKHRPLIRIDLPGHGKSPKLRIANFAALVKEVRRAFDALELENAHLVGHSLGGAASLALADTRPNAIASLSLIAPAGLGPEINGPVLSGICSASRPESIGPWLKTLVADETLITDSYVRLVMAGRSDANLRAAQQAMEKGLFPDGVQAFDLKAALDRCEMPTRIFWGKQDCIIPWKHALRAPGRVGLHLFEGIGHLPHFEAAEDVGKIIKLYI